MKSLNLHKAAFDQVKPHFSLLSIFQPKICGKIDGYNVEMALIWEERSKALIYRVLLENPVKVPWFFWDKLLLSNAGYGELEIQKGKWLTQYACYGETMRQISKQLESKTTEIIKASFRHLITLARKIDSGEMPLDTKIKKQTERFYKEAWILGIMIIVAGAFCYWWIYRN